MTNSPKETKQKSTHKLEAKVNSPADKRKFISTGSEWSFALIEDYETAIAEIALEFKLDTYPNQIEIISSEQMLDAYSSVGMPLGYSHWSYGKQFLQNEKGYKRGQMGLAYEIVINSNPCIAYLMEENTMMMQALVIAHAAYGHNSRAIIYSEHGQMQAQLSTTFYLPKTTLPNASNAMVLPK
jgi:hypothetical protein